MLPSSRGLSPTEAQAPASEPPALHAETHTSKPDDDPTSWIDFCPTPPKEPASFIDPIPPPASAQPLQSQHDDGDKKSSSSSANQHSKLRVLLFDMEDDEDEEDHGASTTTPGNHGDDIDDNADKHKDDRLFKRKETVVSSTSSLPTAIVAPTAFSIAGGSSGDVGTIGCSSVDELAKEVRKEKPATTIAAAKRRRQSPMGVYSQQVLCLQSPPVS